jgi:hypothetical protein
MEADPMFRSLWIILIGFTLSAPQAQAMPMFARKYKMDCTGCHAAVPRLNFTGFKFRAAGFRMPWEIDKPQQDDNILHLENYTAFVAFINGNFGVTSNQSPGGAQLNVQEADVHPLTGSWGANWSSGIEVDFLPDGTVSLNQALLGFTSGTADSFWTAQAGVIPNYLGYGPLDRSLAVSVPLILSNSASNSVQDMLFNWAGPRAAGVTGSYWIGDTFLAASVRNRLAVGVDATGNVTSGPDAQGSPSTNRMGDVLLAATTFFDHTGAGSAVNLAYYRGQTHLPIPGGSGSVYANNFNHLVGSVNYYATERWNFYTGGGWGQDQAVNEGLYHAGYFGGAEYFWGPDLVAGTRYDYFRSDLNTDGTMVKEGTVYFHLRPINQVTFSSEFQFQSYGAVNVNQALQGLNQSVLTLQVLLAF